MTLLLYQIYDNRWHHVWYVRIHRCIGYPICTRSTVVSGLRFIRYPPCILLWTLFCFVPGSCFLFQNLVVVFLLREILGNPGNYQLPCGTVRTYIQYVVDFTSLFFVLPPLDGFINQDACIVMHILCKCSMSNE